VQAVFGTVEGRRVLSAFLHNAGADQSSAPRQPGHGPRDRLAGRRALVADGLARALPGTGGANARRSKTRSGARRAAGSRR
jgi:hypothetical protein